MQIFVWASVLVFSIAVLVKGSDFFVDSAEKIGIALGMPSFIVGVIIVGIGTSLPELITSLAAVVKDTPSIVVSNVMGSNIANIFLILGLAGLIGKRFTIHYDILHTDIPFLAGSALMIVLMIMDQEFSTAEAILCIVLLAIYLIRSFGNSANHGTEKGERATPLAIITLLISPALIYLGANYTIQAVIELSSLLNIGEEIITLSAVALGTSLPEAMVTIQAARKGNPEMSVGNVVGSNIFNTLIVMGIPGIAGNLVIPATVLSFSVPVFLGATFIFILITLDSKVNRGEGLMLLSFYVFFIGSLFHLF